MNPLLIEMELQQRHQEACEVAKRRQLLALYNATHPAKIDKIFLYLANLLIAIGEQLKRRYDHHPALASGQGKEC